jgi:hypothetical protein
MGLKDKENAMASSSTNLFGLLNKSPDAGASHAIASVSGSASGGSASVSASLGTGSNGQVATSTIHATAQAQVGDTHVISTGEAAASGAFASNDVSLIASADPNAETPAIAAATVKSDADAAGHGVASIASLAVTEIETNNIEVTSSGNADAGGETISGLVALDSSADQRSQVLVVGLAQAEATTSEDGTGSAMAGTDAQALGDNLSIVKEQETTATDGSHPAVLSVTYLQGVQAAPADATSHEALVGDIDAATLQTDVGSFNAEL